MTLHSNISSWINFRRPGDLTTNSPAELFFAEKAVAHAARWPLTALMAKPCWSTVAPIKIRRLQLTGLPKQLFIAHQPQQA
jgi:hypothetical protein